MHDDPPIPRTQEAAMYVIVQAVSRGYRWYQQGEVPASKALRLAAKFEEKFDWTADRVRRQFLKRKGLASTRLVMYPGPQRETVLWWLLATDGEVEERAQFQDTWSHRESLTWDARYRLEHLQRPSREGGGRRWTWQVCPQRLAEMTAYIDALCAVDGDRHGDLRKYLEMLARMPGFHGIRRQVLGLLRGAEGTWTRHRRGPWPFAKPDMPYVSATVEAYDRVPVRLSHIARLAAVAESMSTATRPGGSA